MVKRALSVSLLAVFCLSIAPHPTWAGVDVLSIPAGTVIHCRITQTLTTSLNHQGESFTATVTEPVMLGSRQVIAAGATIQGRITELIRPGHFKGVGQMRLTADRMSLPDGRSFPIYATLMTAYGAEGARVDGTEGIIKGPSSRTRQAEEIGGGAILGTVVGLIFHHPLVGATLGGTAGLVDRLRQRGKDLNIPAGTQLNYQLTRSLDFASESAQRTTSELTGTARN